VVELPEFRQYFRTEVNSNYIETFLPSVVIEKGCSVTLTKYLNRIRPGVYHVGFDVVKEQIQKNMLDEKKQADLYASQSRFERGFKSVYG